MTTAACSYNTEDVVKEGYVRVKTNVLGGIFTPWKKRRLVLLRRSSRGPLRLVVVSDPGDVDQLIYLNDYTFITRVDPVIRPHALAISFRSRPCFRFSTESDAEAESWYRAFERETNSPNVVNVNVADELFNVYLLPTSLLDFSGECLLQVTQNELSLINTQHPHAVIAKWPLSTIRQYGHPKNENFTFIAGRSSPTGEGVFLFNTTEAQSIYNKIGVVTRRVANERRSASRSLNRMDELSLTDDHAPVSRSAPPPSRLHHNTTSFGSQPNVIELMSQSAPGHHHHHHHRHQQQQQQQQQQQRWHGRRCRQFSSTTTFFEENVDKSPPYSGDRRLVVAPPPYSRDERAGQSSEISPIRLLFSADDDSPSPPVPSPAAVAAPFARQPPGSPSRSPRRVGALRRQAVSENALTRLPEYINCRLPDDADTGNRTREPPLFPRRKMSAAQIHNVHAEQRSCVARSAAPPPKHHRRHQ